MADKETCRSRAQSAIYHHRDLVGGRNDDDECNIVDLLTDVLLLCDSQEIDFERALRCAHYNFEAEK